LDWDWGSSNPDRFQFATLCRRTCSPHKVSGGPPGSARYAIGDVKYKILTEDWSRTDLYQSIAFATAFNSPVGCVIGFAETTHELPQEAR
jgi:hypothetical protein